MSREKDVRTQDGPEWAEAVDERDPSSRDPTRTAARVAISGLAQFTAGAFLALSPNVIAHDAGQVAAYGGLAVAASALVVGAVKEDAELRRLPPGPTTAGEVTAQLGFVQAGHATTEGSGSFGPR